jgi:hypothetical protein
MHPSDLPEWWRRDVLKKLKCRKQNQLHVTEDSPRFSVDGVGLRAEEKPGGAWWIAVSFARVRFP